MIRAMARRKAEAADDKDTPDSKAGGASAWTGSAPASPRWSGWSPWSARCSWPSARCWSRSTPTTQNALVELVLDGADAVDLGRLLPQTTASRSSTGENAEVKNALFNWGLGAVVYLVVGRILDRLIRP